MNSKRSIPLVSVILPTYNRAKLLPRSVESVLNQTYKNFELIIIDDGSTDNTKEVVQEYIRKDKRVIYLKHRKNKGGSAARNTGIKKAKANYIAFQDSDDEWIYNKLEKQVKIIKKSSYSKKVIYTSFVKVVGTGAYYLPGKDVNKKRGMIYKELLRGNFIGFPTILIDKECFKRVGLLDERFPRNQDWELFLRISKKYPFCFIDEPLLLSFQPKESISTNHLGFIEARKLILERHFADIKKSKKLWSKFECDIGGHQLRYGDKREGLSRLAKSFLLKLTSKISEK
jgi:glycosyltransferase involved in cell wall biosynthesis